MQKGFFFWQTGFTPIIIVIIIALVILGSLVFKSYLIQPNLQLPKPTPVIKVPTPTKDASKKNIHLYPFFGVDSTISINKLHIIGVLFTPKNVTTEIKPEWLINMDKIFAQIKNFYQVQFENNIEITYQVNTIPIKGEKSMEDYSPWDLVKEVEDHNQNLIKKNTHNVWMVYLVTDPESRLYIQGGGLGGVPVLNAATQYDFWLNNNEDFGITGSAHEFGHALGIPHPWDLPANVNHEPNFGNLTKGDIMSYNMYDDLDKNYIRDDVKKEMGL